MRAPLSEPLRKPKEKEPFRSPLRRIKDYRLLTWIRRASGYQTDPILALHDKDSFEKALPLVKDFSRTTAAITGLLAAGSLTFIGLFDVVNFPDLFWLKVSWIALGASTLTQLGTHLLMMAVVAGSDRQRHYEAWENAQPPLPAEPEDIEEELQLAAARIKTELHYRQLRYTVRAMLACLTLQTVFLIVGGAAIIYFASTAV